MVGHVAARKAKITDMDTLPIIDSLDAQRNKVRDYNAKYRLAHPEVIAAAMKRSNAKLTVRRREDPEVRAKHLAERKLYNETHKEQRAAYERVYRARIRLERKMAVERAIEVAAEAGGGGIIG